MHASQVFILSPARLDGRRAQILLSPRAKFPLAQSVASSSGAPLGEVFSFLSGLYFRGKLSYATAFARPPHRAPPILVITTQRGLWSPNERVTRADLEAFAHVDLAKADSSFRGPLRDDALAVSKRAGAQTRIVLLGSIATGKYVDPLLDVFGERLVFPIDFVGRGDMSRGGLLLRAARSGLELEYAPVAGAVRHGMRPPKLAPLRR
ncbi:MAG TPA: hypothetical protein VH762_18765 [Gemmatimonadaceae bacterium]|jgi:hypothetical protein